MADELHAVVRLLLKRMKSHPEEFTYGASGANSLSASLRTSIGTSNRWHSFVQDVIEWGNEADKVALNTALRDIRLGEIHERVMDELLNGEQRRAEKQRRAEEEEKRYLAMQQMPQMQQAQQTPYTGTQGLWGANPMHPTVSADLKAQNLYEQLKQANVMGVKK
jgi:hypothetical protein